MDRVALILPRPDGVPNGERLPLDSERDAPEAEKAVAEQIVGHACASHGLVPVRVLVPALGWPVSKSRGGRSQGV